MYRCICTVRVPSLNACRHKSNHDLGLASILQLREASTTEVLGLSDGQHVLVYNELDACK
jgi:hypothetical protein